MDIQNATLAGGVAIGCVANLSIGPVGAIVVGCVASLVSTYGFNVVQPWLEEKGLHDTCGIHNLHAMPSIVGGFASVFVAIANKDSDVDTYGADYAATQWWRQLLGMLATLALAIVTGLFTGWIASQLKPGDDIKNYNDNMYWEVAEDYGRSLYTELGLVVADTGELDNEALNKSVSHWKPGHGAEALNKLSALDTSSHHGRRPVSPNNNMGEKLENELIGDSRL